MSLFCAAKPGNAADGPSASPLIAIALGGSDDSLGYGAMREWKITEALALRSATAFMLTIVYLYGYSRGLGVNLSLYLSLNDYLRIATEWLPPVLGAGIVGELLSRLFTRVERGATEAQIAARSRNPQFTRTFRRLGDAAVPAVFLLTAVAETTRSFFVSVPPERLYLVWGAASVVLWLLLFFWYIRESKLVAGWSRPLYLCVALIPALAIAALTQGLYSGKTGTRPYSPPADVQIWIKGQTNPLVSRILFVLDDFFVLRGQDPPKVIAIPRAEVTKGISFQGELRYVPRRRSRPTTCLGGRRCAPPLSATLASSGKSGRVYEGAGRV